MCWGGGRRGWTGGHGAAAGPKHRQQSLLLRQRQRVSVVVWVGGVCVCVWGGGGGGDGQVDTVDQLDQSTVSGHYFYDRDNGSVS